MDLKGDDVYYVMFVLYGPISILKFFLSLVFYPIVYPFRKWARKRVYDYDREYIQKTVHGGEGSNPISYEIIEKSKKRDILDWIARFVWWFLDDTPEWSDAGGSFFVESECDGKCGIGQFSFGSYVTNEQQTEAHITDPFRRFVCSYRWAMRNPTVNFDREFLVVRSTGETYEIVYDPTLIGFNTIKEPVGTRYKTDRYGVFNEDRSTLGTQFYIATTESGNKLPCFESAGRKKLFGKTLYWDVWYGFLRGTLRFESAIRIGVERG